MNAAIFAATSFDTQIRYWFEGIVHSCSARGNGIRLPTTSKTHRR